MSLDFTLDKIEGYKQLCWKVPGEGELEANDHTMFGRPVTADGLIQSPITHALIFGCLTIGIGEITEANAEEWWIRYRSWELAGGWNSTVTFEDVKAHIGLRTNVFPKETAAKFNKRLVGVLEDRVRAEMKRLKEMTDLLECGCPRQIVQEEGHQEGCDYGA